MTTGNETTWCDCSRDSDWWACQARDSGGWPGRCQPGTGKGCALRAVIETTGRDRWDYQAEVELKRKPCVACR